MSETIGDKLRARQIEAERLFCACVFGAPDIALRECSWLLPSIFIDEPLKQFWSDVIDGKGAITAAADNGVGIEIASRMGDVPMIIKPDIYAKVIGETAYMRNIMRGISGVVASVGELDIDKVRSSIEKLSETSLPSSMPNETIRSGELSGAFMDRVRNPLKCVLTHIPALDNSIGGCYATELIVLAARPGMGKTSLATQIARNVAAHGQKALFFSLEMSAEQLWGRMACPAAGVEWRNVRAGRIDNAQFSNLEAQSISLSQSYGDNLIIAENALTIFAIQRIAADTRPDIVIIDQLPEIIWHDPDEKEVSWYGKACRYFRNMIAKRLNVPVILIHQLNRAVEERQNKRPVLADLRWSGEIEQRADVVLMCYREDYYDDGSNPITRVPFELWTRKHRQGVKDSLVILEYDLKDQWFY